MKNITFDFNPSSIDCQCPKSTSTPRLVPFSGDHEFRPYPFVPGGKEESLVVDFGCPDPL
jgi:hypothetical protein